MSHTTSVFSGRSSGLDAIREWVEEQFSTALSSVQIEDTRRYEASVLGIVIGLVDDHGLARPQRGLSPGSARFERKPLRPEPATSKRLVKSRLPRFSGPRARTFISRHRLGVEARIQQTSEPMARRAPEPVVR